MQTDTRTRARVISLTDQEHARLKRLARENGLTMSDLIRTWMRQESAALADRKPVSVMPDLEFPPV